MFEILPLAFSAPAEGAAAPNPILQLVPLLLVVAIFWLLILNPQRKRQAEHRKLMDSLKKGDRVLTGSGLYGTVAQVKEKEGTVLLEVDANTKLLFARQAITSRLDAPSGGKKAKEQKA